MSIASVHSTITLQFIAANCSKMNLLEIAAPFEVSKRLLIEYQSMVYGFSIVEPNCSVKMLKMSVKIRQTYFARPQYHASSTIKLLSAQAYKHVD